MTAPLLTDETIAAWTSAHDQMRMGESVIPTALVIAEMRRMRDEAQGRIAKLTEHTERQSEWNLEQSMATGKLQAGNAELLAACEAWLAWIDSRSIRGPLADDLRAAIERAKEANHVE